MRLKASMIYFIKAGGYVKIGFSADPVARLRQLQTSSPIEMEIILTMKGLQTTEATLHRVFEDLQVERGGTEWFRYSGRLKSCVDAMRMDGRKFVDPETLHQFVDNGIHLRCRRAVKRAQKRALRDRADGKNSSRRTSKLLTFVKKRLSKRLRPSFGESG